MLIMLPGGLSPCFICSSLTPPPQKPIDSKLSNVIKLAKFQFTVILHCWLIIRRIPTVMRTACCLHDFNRWPSVALLFRPYKITGRRGELLWWPSMLRILVLKPAQDIPPSAKPQLPHYPLRYKYPSRLRYQNNTLLLQHVKLLNCEFSTCSFQKNKQKHSWLWL